MIMRVMNTEIPINIDKLLFISFYYSLSYNHITAMYLIKHLERAAVIALYLCLILTPSKLDVPMVYRKVVYDHQMIDAVCNPRIKSKCGVIWNFAPNLKPNSIALI